MAKKESAIKIKSISKRMLSRGFDTDLELEDGMIEMQDVLQNGGYVYGLYQDRILVGIYAVRKIEEYFKAQYPELDVEVDGDEHSALCLTYYKTIPEIKKSLSKVERTILMNIKEQVFLGTVAGIQWKKTLHYHKKVQKEWMYNLIGLIVGLILGVIVGRTLFRTWMFGFIFGGIGLFLGIVIAMAFVHEMSISTLKIKKNNVA